VVALITIFGVSTSPPGTVSPSVAPAAPPRTVARVPDNVPAEPARPSQPSQPRQDGPASIASGTTFEVPIVTPPSAVSETQKRARPAARLGVENPAPTSGPATNSLSESHAQALDTLRPHDAPTVQHQSAETTAAPRVEAFIGIWAREPAECRNRATDDQRIKIDAHSAESSGGRCAFRSIRQEDADRWRVRASCNAALDSWTAHISLRMIGPNLRWSSERGTETYVRCPSPAGPVRQAGAAR
jgi:type IV secretory pathway VirB10-like protein